MIIIIVTGSKTMRSGIGRGTGQTTLFCCSCWPRGLKNVQTICQRQKTRFAWTTRQVDGLAELGSRDARENLVHKFVVLRTDNRMQIQN